VFTGTVTEIEEGEMMTLHCQGHLLELMESPPVPLNNNSYRSLGMGSAAINRVGNTVIDAVGLAWGAAWKDLKSTFSAAPGFGGWNAFGEDGTAAEVIRAMLTSPQAKHFGHWQIGVGPSKMLKGFEYKAMLSGTAKAAGLPTLASQIDGAYDRSCENVMVDSGTMQLDANGTLLAGPMRSWMHERPAVGFLPAQYSVPDDPGITPWRVIKDISRRYPEMVLQVRPYGYLFGADSTLVFGHPNDSYMPRPLAFGEDEIDTLHPATDDEAFIQWWAAHRNAVRADIEQQVKASGAFLWQNVLLHFLDKYGQAPGQTPAPGTKNPATSTETLNRALQIMEEKKCAAFDAFTDTLFDLAARIAGAQKGEPGLLPELPQFIRGPASYLAGNHAAAVTVRDFGRSLRRRVHGYLQQLAQAKTGAALT
jgi:hypothetical protein